MSIVNNLIIIRFTYNTSESISMNAKVKCYNEVDLGAYSTCIYNNILIILKYLIFFLYVDNG